MKNLLAILILTSILIIGCAMPEDQTADTKTITKSDTVYISPKIWVDKVFYLDQ